jgi:hypothetical protein
MSSSNFDNVAGSQPSKVEQATKTMMESIAKFRVDVLRFQKNHLFALKCASTDNNPEAFEAITSLIGYLSSKSALARDDSVLLNLRDNVEGLLVPSDDWKGGWDKFLTDPSGWNTSEYLNEDLRSLYLHVVHGKSDANRRDWDSVVNSCEETLRKWDSYWQKIRPKSRLDLGRATSITGVTIIGGVTDGSFALGCEPASIYDCGTEAGSEGFISELALRGDKKSIDLLLQRIDHLKGLVFKASELSKTYEDYSTMLTSMEGE